MSTPSSAALSDNSGIDTDLLLAHSTRVPDLPGAFKKKAVINPEETGMVTSNGTVVSQLSSGANSVGWSILGFGGGNKNVVRVHNRPFTLRLYFTNLISQGYDTLDGIVHLTASISEPTQFHNAILRNRESLQTSELAATVGAAVDDFFQVRVAQSDIHSLRDDEDTRDAITEELRPHLERALSERGLRLQSVDFVAFRNPDEATELLDQLDEVENLIQAGSKPGSEDIKRLLGRLEAAGLATPDMAERAQLLFDGGTNDAFFGAMNNIMVASRRRLEAQAVTSSDQLARKLDSAPEPPPPTKPSGSERVMQLIAPISGIVGVSYKIITDIADRSVGGVSGWIVLIGGLVGAVVFLGGYFGIRAKRLMSMKTQDDVIIRLDRWSKKDSMQTDELIRRQMGRELANAVGDVRDAKLTAFRQEKQDIANGLNELENRMDLVRTEVESAPAASTIVSQKGYPRKRIIRMVRFEEEMLRYARNLSIRSQTAKTSLASDDVQALEIGLDNFQRTFSKRQGLLEGFREL
ncbi:MAG: hypothetical protein IIC24_01005 [Chloroflexi bacterium]|nr:hypothetical protein [Chloroflexota bacterium]